MKYREFKTETMDHLALLDVDDQEIIKAMITKQGSIKLGDVDKTIITNDLVLMAKDLSERESSLSKEFSNQEEEIQKEILGSLKPASFLEKMLYFGYSILFQFAFILVLRSFVNGGNFRSTIGREIIILLICIVGIFISNHVSGMHRFPHSPKRKKVLRTMIQAFPGFVVGIYFVKLNNGHLVINGFLSGGVIFALAGLCRLLLAQYWEKEFSRLQDD